MDPGLLRLERRVGWLRSAANDARGAPRLARCRAEASVDEALLPGSAVPMCLARERRGGARQNLAVTGAGRPRCGRCAQLDEDTVLNGVEG